MKTDDFEHLRPTLERNGRVLLIELDHGHANEMGSPQLREWERICDRLESNDNAAPRALITYSRRRSKRGTPIFISGANVTERTGWSDQDVKRHVRWQRAVLARVRRLPVMHIAVVDGVALGWGVEFMICCDYRIAGPSARFALPETGLGILPGAGGTSELWALIGPSQALRLGMTGESIDGTEAARIGLVQETVDSPDAGLARARDLAGMAATRSPTAVAAFKSGVIAAIGMSAEERVEREARAYEHCVDTGEAAIGRAAFKAIRSGGEAEWGPRALPPR